MIKLKDVLAISHAHELKIKDVDAGKIIWAGLKGGDGYEEVVNECGYCEIMSISAKSKGCMRNSVKSILVLEIKRWHPTI